MRRIATPRTRTCPRGPRTWGTRIFVHQPQTAALGELFREVGEERGEDLACAALRAANKREHGPRAGLVRHIRRVHGHRVPEIGSQKCRMRREPPTMLLLFVLFEDIERVAMMELHADRSEDGSD